MKKKILSVISIACCVFTLNAVCCDKGQQKDCCQQQSTTGKAVSDSQRQKSCCPQPSKECASIEVIYFHGKQRCATCISIENNSRDLVNDVYADKVKFTVVDFSTEEGKKMAADFKVSFSSLFIVSRKNGQEHRTDMTRTGFQYAKNNPEEFKKQLLEAIQTQLDK